MTPRRLAILLTASLVVGCAASTGPPRAPGSFAAIHLAANGPDGVVDLATERTRRKIGTRVAEDQGDLDDIWDDAEFRAPPPKVDFRARVIVTFDHEQYCNSTWLTGLAVTSSGEVVPEIESTNEICEQMGGGEYELWRLYVMSLPRRLVPAGKYVVRLGGHSSNPFTLKGTAPRPAPRTAEPLPVPSPGALPGGAHSRRARVVSREKPAGEEPPDEAAGVWVRDDAVWFPFRSSVEAVLAKDLLACDERACVPGFTRSSCEGPECPARGELLITERPLRARDPWPTSESDWNHLMEEMAEDPVLSEMLRQPVEPDRHLAVVTYPHPPPRKIGWLAHPFTSFAFEQALGGSGGVFVRDGAALGGLDLRLGVRYSRYSSSTSGPAYWIREGSVGTSWGIDVHGRALEEVRASGTPRRWASVGVAVAADNPLGHDDDESRVRVPSLLGLMLPEMGLMVSSDAATSFYLGHSFPMAVLIGERFAVEARPAFTLRFTSGREAGPDAMTSLSLSVMHR